MIIIVRRVNWKQMQTVLVYNTKDKYRLNKMFL